MTDIDAFNKKSKSMYSIQAVERSSLLAITKDDFDKLFLEYPEFIQRIPQKILVSFLGFMPEYLSELRKKHLKK